MQKDEVNITVISKSETDIDRLAIVVFDCQKCALHVDYKVLHSLEDLTDIRRVSDFDFLRSMTVINRKFPGYIAKTAENFEPIF